MFLTAARLLQRGKLKPEEAACRLRFLGIQLTLGELAEPFSRDRFTELFLESEKWQRTDWLRLLLLGTRARGVCLAYAWGQCPAHPTYYF